MSARGMLSVVGTAVGGIIGWNDSPPPLDAESLRALLTEIGLPPGDGDAALAVTLRAFQARAGLAADGVAGPRTVHLLTRYAADARGRRLGMAA